MALPISDEIRDKIVGLYEAGKSRLEIQIVTKVSQPTIRKILIVAGYKSNEIREPVRLTTEIHAEIIRLRNTGLGYQRIADEVGISKRTVMNVVKDSSEDIEGRGSGRVSAEQFIKTWQTSETTDEVAQKLNIKLHSVWLRATQYRQRGVPLKRYSTRPRTMDWDELSEFASLFSDEESEDGA